jgi:lambda repressor-like predicted transcriptional regulator
MFKNKKYSLIAIGVLVLALAFGLVAFTSINTASAAASDDGFNHRGRPGGFRPAGADSGQALADELGISLEELQAAHESVRAVMLETAVAEGKLTQEQADKIAERGFPVRHRHFGLIHGEAESLLAEALGISVEELQAARERVQAAAIEQALADGKITEEQAALMEARQALRNYIQKDELIAEALGITVSELDAAREDGQRLPDLMDELGVESEAFEANMRTLREEALEQAVDDGVITQDQAEELLENNFRGFHCLCRPGFPAGKKGFWRP